MSTLENEYHDIIIDKKFMSEMQQIACESVNRVIIGRS